ncbi:MAG: peptide chain release factor family protein, partial [Candidatus Binatia bacterium]
MALFPISSDKERQLLARMLALGVREQDIDEQFVRSSGAGGQNVNKVASCVVLPAGPACVTARLAAETSSG